MASYVFDLPSRVGYNAAMDTAISCVAAALRWRSSLRHFGVASSEDFLLLYGKALRAIQCSIEDAEQCLTAETLAATELLCMFEALIRETKRPSAQHAAGVYHLVQHRGAERFATEFEKSLLAAYASVLIIDAYFGGKHLFLEEPEWQSVLQSCIIADPKVGDRSALRISLLQALTYAPGVLSDCALFINDQKSDKAEKQKLLCRVDQFRTRLYHWHSVWGSHAFHPFNSDGSLVREIKYGEQHKWGEMLGQLCIYEAFLVVFNRLHVALRGSDAHNVEAQSQRIAKNMVDMGAWKDCDSTDEIPRCVTHGVRPNAVQETVIFHCLGAARAVLATMQEWATATSHPGTHEPVGQKALIDKDIFLRWYNSQGFIIHRRE
ncbi:hypothetical protein NLG97_g1438 [Lecanicillium saksenae]|uniref:Uncharacterized protein n=1 Tax=Lecanicillium saksenae TaxID=468837 RepID=A0ACC1R773_9HYPO|nr:hypothetical protein NLG97_g1438 [Lecanicillium saksenae]